MCLNYVCSYHIGNKARLNTHSLFYLPLVTLELVLEFLHKFLHALVGLVVLLSLEDQLL